MALHQPRRAVFKREGPRFGFDTTLIPRFSTPSLTVNPCYRREGDVVRLLGSGGAQARVETSQIENEENATR